MKWFRLYTEIIDDPKMRGISDSCFRTFIGLMAIACEAENGILKMSIQDIAWRLRVMPPYNLEKQIRKLSELGILNILNPDSEDVQKEFKEPSRGVQEEFREPSEGVQEAFKELSKDVQGEFKEPSKTTSRIGSNKWIEIVSWDKRQFKSDNVSARVSKHRGESVKPRKASNVTLQETLHVTPTETDTETDTESDTETDSDTHKEKEEEKEKAPLLETQPAAKTASTSKPARAPERVSSNGLFDTFWRSYPKKQSKGQAEKAFRKINPDEQLLATMIATIERAKTSEDWCKEGGRFIPHPATWLNNRRWEDEDVETHPLSGKVSDLTLRNLKVLQNWRPDNGK